eukprot:scaffold55165_cov35-Tisochrysis_lutea.AAC.4
MFLCLALCVARPPSGSTPTRARPPTAALVDILTTGPNSRRISSSIVVDAAQDDVWAVITDYDRIADYTPNVLCSRVVSAADAPRVRVFQEGSQNIAGFEFRASLTMEMTPITTDALRRPLPAPRLAFRYAPPLPTFRLHVRRS